MFSFFHCLPSIFFLLYHILFCLSNRVWGQTKPKKAAKKTDPPTELTTDDLIRVVTQKIKKDRSNKEKVLALLKSYGAAKVSDIPADKYEAFLTDVSQL